jgi:HK97 family phage major capsid protein
MPGSGSQTGKPMVLFGDLSMAASVGDRRTMTVRLLRERFAEEGCTGAMLSPRFDINVHDLGDNSTAGPLVALLGA